MASVAALNKPAPAPEIAPPAPAIREEIQKPSHDGMDLHRQLKQLVAELNTKNGGTEANARHAEKKILAIIDEPRASAIPIVKELLVHAIAKGAQIHAPELIELMGKESLQLQVMNRRLKGKPPHIDLTQQTTPETEILDYAKLLLAVGPHAAETISDTTGKISDDDRFRSLEKSEKAGTVPAPAPQVAGKKISGSFIMDRALGVQQK